MTFGQLISAAGHDVKEFPRLSCITLQLFDGKDRLITEDLNFARNLFADNPFGAKEFYEWLVKKEAVKEELPKYLIGKLLIDAVILHWPKAVPEFFFRFG